MGYNRKQLKSVLILSLAMMGILIMPFFIPGAKAVFQIPLDSLQVSDSLGQAINPDIVWSGSVYGLVWSDSRHQGEPEIYFAKLNELGGKTAREIKISDSSDKISDEPAIVWADNVYAVVWSEYDRDESSNQDGCYLYLNRLDKSGKKYGGIISIVSDNYGTCPSNPALVWTGLEYGISWQETRLGNETSKIFFTRLNSLGEKQGKDVQVSQTANSENFSVVWTGSEYGLVWQSNGEIYFSRLDVNGVKQGSDIRVSNLSDVSSSPDITWSDSAYGVVWSGYDSKGQQQIYFAKLDEKGNKQTDERALTSNEGEAYSVYPSIIWRDSEYGVVWQQTSGLIYFVGLDIDGNKKSQVLQISNKDSGLAKQPALALGTSQYAFVWQETNQSGEEIYFTKIAFSDVAQNNQELLLAFIENLNGNSWLIIVLILIAIILFWGIVYLVKKK